MVKKNEGESLKIFLLLLYIYVNHLTEFIMTVTFEWKTGTPEHTGKYLITDKYGHTDVDYWYNPNDGHKVEDGWHRHYEEDVIAWCELCDIPSYPNKVNY